MVLDRYLVFEDLDPDRARLFKLFASEGPRKMPW